MSASHDRRGAPSRATPAVTVVIPTRNRRASLCRTLEALARQTFPVSDFEVIVAADGCTDDTAAAVERFDAPYALRLVQLPGSGAATARNRGAAEARGRLLLFVDDDVEPSPGLIAAHVEAHGRARAGGAGVSNSARTDVVGIGPCLPVLVGRVGLFQRKLRSWWVSEYERLARPGHRFTSRDVLSGNLSIGAEHFRRLGGFDTAFHGAAEDWEFGVRLVKSDAELVYVGAAVAWHHIDLGLERSFQRTRHEGRADVLMGLRHPELRPVLPLAQGLDAHGAEWLCRMGAFRAPVLGDLVVKVLGWQLRVHEALRMRRAWQGLSGLIRRYWYWRGVAEELGRSGSGPAEFVAAAADAGAPEPVSLDVDLANGLDVAEDMIDLVRPDALCLYHEGREIGELPPVPGAERLRGRHLRPLLFERFGRELIGVLAVAEVQGRVRAGRHPTPLHPEEVAR